MIDIIIFPKCLLIIAQYLVLRSLSDWVKEKVQITPPIYSLNCIPLSPITIIYIFYIFCTYNSKL